MYTTKEELLERINRLISVTLVILTLSIVISFIFELGYNTYSDRMGTRGSRGFFYAGNDITAILVLLMPLSMAAFINSGWRDAGKLKKLLAVAPSVLAANSLAIIGSKTAFLGVGITFGAILLFAVIKLILNKDNTVLLGILFILVSSAIFFVVVMLISSGSLLSSVLNSLFATGFIVEEEGLEAAMFSGRQIKLKDQFGQFKDAGMLVWLFGMGRGSQEVIIEMDIFEVLFYYGLLGFFTMLWLYLRLGLALLAGVFKKFSLTGFCILISLVLCTGYLVAAGHILFSVTSGFYFSFTILYSRVYLSDKPQDVLLFRY